MFSSTLQSSIILVLFIIPFINAQASGYIGYNLNQTGDPNSAVYETDETDTAGNTSILIPDPDVFLNASVHVGEIDITVQNLTAKINLQAQVLELLNFNAGVDVSIDRVELLIQNVSAQVMLEARLANLVLMIDDVLSSLDLNPVLATLRQDVGEIVNTTVGGLTGSDSSSSATKRGLAYNLAHNVLYSVNDYSGHTHTNRILSQSGSIVDQSLDDDGNVLSSRDVGSFLMDMSYNGYNQTMVLDGKVVHEIQYLYTPYNGLSVVSAIYIDDSGSVVATQVLSEASGGGESTIGN